MEIPTSEPCSVVSCLRLVISDDAAFSSMNWTKKQRQFSKPPEFAISSTQRTERLIGDTLHSCVNAPLCGVVSVIKRGERRSRPLAIRYLCRVFRGCTHSNCDMLSRDRSPVVIDRNINLPSAVPNGERRRQQHLASGIAKPATSSILLFGTPAQPS